MRLILAIVLPILIVAGGAATLLYGGAIGGVKRSVESAPTAARAPAPATLAAAHVYAPEPPVDRRGAGTGPASEVRTRERGDRRPPATPSRDPVIERKIARLASVYEQLPAEDAARILASLPDPLVEAMLSRIDERQLGKILLALGPKRAARLTEALAR